ncbi:HtrA2 peptidase [Stanieria cyanosphaera PCC 7437]|uniref:HtrA2 peptidase n=1 Tax=Stanieria cyanosphaera (strain ATCC 29371 / PCC 7437) TaxID=111780 RepID=K9XPC5_STAC7|nr:HhoA/HhoB/HtrA family serine endopeptidase [Stanieria cyanosphaera]AFZ34383.1 HtrA2 peptidase [Stanieria cyanosphaera PCC 7437]
MNQQFSISKAFGSLLLLLFGGGIALGGNYLVNHPQAVANLTNKEILESKENKIDWQETTSANNNTSNQIAVPQNFVTQVVEQVGPAVVRIDASRTVTTQVPAVFEEPFFREYFGSQIPEMPQEQIQRGLGSGFILSSDGLILTNAHVVDGADNVEVTLKNGRSFEGKVMGTDPLTDIAVIKIEAQNLPTVTFADSEEIQPGEWAIAIGNPLGLDNTVTTGIVSATGRSGAQVGVADKRVSFIQTDAAINPGNSGGPLLNAQGEVIGVNTAIIRNAQGLGFAIPIDTARNIAEELIAKGKVDHPFLGIQMATITPELKQQLKSSRNLDLTADQGVLIVNVVPNSPAQRAGLQSGDIIQSINKQEVQEPSEVQQLVEETAIGNQLLMSLQRDGKTIDLNVEVGVLPTPQSSNQ